MSLYAIPSPTLKCEESLITYVSSSLSGSYGTSSYQDLHYYRGMENLDKEGSVVIIECGNATEVYFGTRNYSFEVVVAVKQMAEDVTRDTFQTLAGNIFSMFTDSPTASAAINSAASNFRVFQVQITNFNESRVEDAWVATLNISVIGALAP